MVIMMGFPPPPFSGCLYFVHCSRLVKRITVYFYFAPKLHKVHAQVLSTGTSSSCGAPPSCSGSGLYRFPILSWNASQLGRLSPPYRCSDNIWPHRRADGSCNNLRETRWRFLLFIFLSWWKVWNCHHQDKCPLFQSMSQSSSLICSTKWTVSG